MLSQCKLLIPFIKTPLPQLMPKALYQRLKILTNSFLRVAVQMCATFSAKARYVGSLRFSPHVQMSHKQPIEVCVHKMMDYTYLFLGQTFSV